MTTTIPLSSLVNQAAVLLKKSVHEVDDLDVALMRLVKEGRVSYKLDPDGQPRFFLVTN